MKWTDGSLYEGEWRNNIQDGYGRMIFDNKEVKEGIFKNNVFMHQCNKPHKEGYQVNREGKEATNEAYYDNENDYNLINLDIDNKSQI